MNYLNTQFDLNDPDLVAVFDEVPLWSAPFGLKILEVIKYRPGMTVLDIGFGTGFPLLEIAMRLGAAAKVYGIDPWKAGQDRTRKKVHLYKIGNVELIDGTAESIPLPDRSVDLIVSNNGINNVHDLSQVLSECNRIARQGAQFISSMNLDTTMIEFYHVMESVLYENHMAAEVEKMKGHIHAKRRPLEEVTALVEANNFKIVQIHKDRFDYRFSSGTAMLEYHFIRMAFLDSWKNIIPPERQDRIFGLIEHSLNNLAEKKGELRLSVPFAVIDSEKN